MKQSSKLMTALILSFTLPAFFAGNAIAAKGGKHAKADQTVVSTTDDDSDSDSDNDTDTSIDTDTPLDKNEASHLIFMREEEKLARDVYLSFAEMYPRQRVFARIATQSEQTHTDVMRDRIIQYNLTDPNPETNNLPESLGVFKGKEWGWYFAEKFTELTKWGSESELAALKAGAFIEELDMHDIAECPDIMIENNYPAPCGLNYTDEKGLINAYSSLMDGSESHLKAYVGQIEAVIGVGNYEAQYLSQKKVDAILGR